jgi:hypothetical protein
LQFEKFILTVNMLFGDRKQILKNKQIAQDLKRKKTEKSISPELLRQNSSRVTLRPNSS